MSVNRWSEPDCRWYGTGVRGRYIIYRMPENGRFAVFINPFTETGFGDIKHLTDCVGLDEAKMYCNHYDGED